MGWPAWLLLVLLFLAVILLIAAHLFRFSYAFDYVFPSNFHGQLVLSFLGRRRVIPFGELLEDMEADEDEGLSRDPDPAAVQTAQAAQASSGPGSAPGPRPGQEGFLAMPWRARRAGLRKRLKAATLKWALDVPVWRLLARFTLHTGFSTLRLIGPSLERLHVGAADIGALGRFASWFSAAAGMFAFLACPVEYGFNERPFALRLRVSGGCTAFGLLGFALAWIFSIPWKGLFRRFVHCWRDPRLNRLQRRILKVAA